MTLIKRVSSKAKSCYILQTNEQTFLLDYPSEVYGKDLSFPSFSRKPRPLRLVIPEFTDDIDYILVTRSDSLGVLFLKRDIPIYITEPVFEQILMRFKGLSNLMVHYEDEDEPSVCIEQGDVERFKRNVRFIRFNEQCEFNDVLFIPKPAGTFVGWINYLIELEDKKTIYYLTSLSNKSRFSSEPVIVSSDYLIINTDNTSNTLHQINEFSAYIKSLESIAIVPLEMTTLLVEIMFHVLFLLQDQDSVPVCVASSVFNHLYTIVNVESDWLSKQFSSMKDPFPVKSYKKLLIANDLTEVPSTSGPMIVFCDPLELSLFPSKIFKSQEIISINNSVSRADHNYNLKLELTVEEIIAGHLGKVIHDLKPDEYFYIETNATHSKFAIDGCNIQVHKNRVYLHGKLKFSDANSLIRKKMVFVQKECKLNDLFANSRFFFRNDIYYFLDKGIKVLIKKDKAKLMNIKNE